MGLTITDLNALKNLFDDLKINHRVTALNCTTVTVVTITEDTPSFVVSEKKTKLIGLVADFASDNPHLTKLSLTNCNLESANLQPLYRSNGWHRLTDVDVSNNNLTALELPDNGELTAIKFTANCFSKDMLGTLYQSTVKHRQVVHLNLTGQRPKFLSFNSGILVAASSSLESLSLCVDSENEANHLAQLLLTTSTLRVFEVIISSDEAAKIVLCALEKNRTVNHFTFRCKYRIFQSRFKLFTELAQAIKNNHSIKHFQFEADSSLQTQKVGTLGQAIASAHHLLTFQFLSKLHEASRQIMTGAMQSKTLLNICFTNLSKETVILDASVVTTANGNTLLSQCKTDLTAKTDPFENYRRLERYVTLINDIEDIEALTHFCNTLKPLVYPELCAHYLRVNDVSSYLEIAELREADPKFKQLIAWLMWAKACLANDSLDTVSPVLAAYRDTTGSEESQHVRAQFKTEQLRLRQKAEERESVITNNALAQLRDFLAATPELQENSAIEKINRLLTTDAIPPYLELKTIAADALAKQPARSGLFAHQTIDLDFLSMIANAYDYAHLENSALLTHKINRVTPHA